MADSKEMDEYNNPDNGLLHMHLCLDHVTSHYNNKELTFKYNYPNKFNLNDFRKVLIKNYGNTKNGWNSIYFINHDYIRPVSLIGDDQNYPFETAKMICMMLFTLQGSPIIF